LKAARSALIAYSNTGKMESRFCTADGYSKPLARLDAALARAKKETPSGLSLDKRETATVLAALRKFQRDAGNVRQLAHMMATEHFKDIKPLSLDEIDALCERINFAPAVASPHDNEPFSGSHAPDCTYRMGHAAPCNCWRSGDPKKRIAD
jgi:hypothetical protein